MDFLGGSEISARTEMLSMTNTIHQAEIQAKKTENKADSAYLQQLQKVTKDFESIFLGYMLKQMRKTVPPDPIFGDSNAKNIFYDMYDESLSKELSKAGGIGLAAIMYKQMAAAENAKKPAQAGEIQPVKK